MAFFSSSPEKKKAIINKAFRSAARSLHPDSLKATCSSESNFNRIVEARDELIQKLIEETQRSDADSEKEEINQLQKHNEIRERFLVRERLARENALRKQKAENMRRNYVLQERQAARLAMATFLEESRLRALALEKEIEEKKKKKKEIQHRQMIKTQREAILFDIGRENMKKAELRILMSQDEKRRTEAKWDHDLHSSLRLQNAESYSKQVDAFRRTMKVGREVDGNKASEAASNSLRPRMQAHLNSECFPSSTTLPTAILLLRGARDRGREAQI